MCIGVPLRVLDGDDCFAWCADDDGARERIDMVLVGAQPAGSWVLAFHGAARQVLSETEAARMRAARAALAAALAGDDIDAFFADLVAREPELPAHLRADSRGAIA
ncbi:MAG TPA: HypC/HybG/HupF family hydrogenase formation chaperone [Burkholderiaceae bacterium]|jgi:hydrogenase expression/formation protein HypC|nr:HypC/HybG/HupF family hydrogenase formation chaperone [Burkholderiaceae bacterium]